MHHIESQPYKEAAREQLSASQGQRPETGILMAFRGNHPAGTLVLDLQNYEKLYFCYLCHLVCVFCYDSLSKKEKQCSISILFE